MGKPQTPSLFTDPESTPARDEMNFAEFPIAVLSPRAADGQTKLVFEDRIFDQGAKAEVVRRLTVRATEDFGLASPLDEEVLLGLLALTKIKNNFADPKLTFTRYELVQLLGWPLKGGSYERLVESLKRWASLTLEYQNAWWDKSRGEWVDVTFHVLNTVVINKPTGNTQAGLVHIEWNEVAFKSFEAGYLKRIDLGFYRSLELAVSKRLYRFLDKHFYKTRRLEYDLLTLAFEKVGLSRDYEPWKVKQKLEPAISELEEKGYLEPLGKGRYIAAGKGRWRVVFAKKQKAIEAKPEAEPPPAAVPPLVSALTGRGVSPATAKELVAKHPAERITRHVEAFDYLVQKKDRKVSKSPPGFLVKAIETDFPLPHGFVPAAEKKAKEEAHRKKIVDDVRKRADEDAAAAKKEAERRAEIDRVLSRMPEAERAKFLDRALRSGGSLAQSRYADSVKSGNTAAAERYRYMLIEQALKSPGCSPVAATA